MPKFKVFAEWKVCRLYEVEAESLEHALDKVMDNADGKYPNTGGEPIDDSFDVRADLSEQVEE